MMADERLQQVIIDYLEARGWYFDWEHAKDLTWYAAEEKIREAHAWTVPQWEEYWTDPRHPEKPPRRRYENLQEALWSQLLREEKPETFGVFFDDKESK